MRTLSALAALLSLTAQAGEVTGYLDSRTQLSRARIGGLLPTDDLPQLNQLLEVNAQVKHGYAERGFVSGDLSLFAQLAGLYVGEDASGEEVGLAPHDVAATRPLVSLNELYLSHDFLPELSLLVGKKRVVWGSGLAANPTDLLNPPKDPTDPNFQRAGSYMVRLEIPLEQYAFTFLASPQVLATHSGLPSQVLVYPGWDRQDEELHYQLAARAYALWFDTDVNVMLFYGNRYGDLFEDKLRGGLSLSRVVLGALELHLEALLQTGASRNYPNGACLEDRVAALRCALRGDEVFAPFALQSEAFLPRVLVGGRYQFADESLLSAEYLFQADGYSRTQFQDYVSGLELLREVRRATGSAPTFPGLGGGEGGIPQKFSFQPVGKHYAFLTFQKPKIRDDFTAQLTVVANLVDLSGLLAPSLSWSATEWLTLSAHGFVPVAGPRALSALTTAGERISEYGLLPLSWRAILEARLYY